MQLVSEISNLCGPESRALRTDRQTTCDRNTALCTIVHRAVKITQAVAVAGVVRHGGCGKLRCVMSCVAECWKTGISCVPVLKLHCPKPKRLSKNLLTAKK